MHWNPTCYPLPKSNRPQNPRYLVSQLQWATLLPITAPLGCTTPCPAQTAINLWTFISSINFKLSDWLEPYSKAFRITIRISGLQKTLRPQLHIKILEGFRAYRVDGFKRFMYLANHFLLCKCRIWTYLASTLWCYHSPEVFTKLRTAGKDKNHISQTHLRGQHILESNRVNHKQYQMTEELCLYVKDNVSFTHFTGQSTCFCIGCLVCSIWASTDCRGERDGLCMWTFQGNCFQDFVAVTCRNEFLASVQKTANVQVLEIRIY